jgi:hypothetical protein
VLLLLAVVVFDPDTRAAAVHLADEAIPDNLNVAGPYRVVEGKVLPPEDASEDNVELGPCQTANPQSGT